MTSETTISRRGARATKRSQRNRGHFIEVRVLALDTIAALGTVDIAHALGDPDPDFRAAAVALVPVPTPEPMFAPLAKAIRDDADADVVRDGRSSRCANRRTKRSRCSARKDSID